MFKKVEEEEEEKKKKRAGKIKCQQPFPDNVIGHFYLIIYTCQE